VEKVVYPPQKPVTKNHFSWLSFKLFLAKIPINKPIKKQPITLAINVANGKLNPEVSGQNLETKTVVR